MDNLIDFRKMNWISTVEEFRQKNFSRGRLRIRIVELDEGFYEEEWCTKSHLGFVLEGRLGIEFSESVLCIEEGNGFWIEGNESEKHKAFAEDCKKVRVLLLDQKDL